MNTLRVVLSIGALLLLTACASEESDFEKARTANTVEAYHAFLDKYDSGEFRDEALTAVATVVWDSVSVGGSVDQIRKYITDYPKSEFLDEAFAMLWDSARGRGSLDEVRRFIDEYPENGLIKEALAVEEQLVWENAAELATKAACEDYLTTYPSGRYVAEASRFILFHDFDHSLKDFINGDKSRIKSICGRRMDVEGAELYLKPGKVTEYYVDSVGRVICSPGCLVINEFQKDVFAVHGVIGEKGKLASVDEVVLGKGATIVFEGDIQYRYDGTEWLPVES